MTEKWIESTRGRTHYWISRRPGAPVLVFLHGLTADHTLFDAQLSYFSKKFTVLAWDSPAHGKSRPYADFSYLHCAVELKSILDCENIRRCVLIGQSMGGYQAQLFIAHWPERVRGFAAIDSCPFGARYYSKSDLWWLKQVEWMSRLFPFDTLKRCIAHSVSRTEYGRENMREALKPYSKRELCHLMGLGYTSFLKENCEVQIPCPAILLVGEHDRTGRVRHYCEAWRKETLIPLYTIKGGAHNANADNPLRTNRILHAFFNSLRAEPEASDEKPEIRTMTQANWPEVRRIYAQAVLEGKSTFTAECPDEADWDAAHLDACRLMILSDGNVAGWCALMPTSNVPAYAGAAEVSIYIDAKYRGCGYGAVLLEKLCDESEKAGLWTLYASIFSENEASIGLFSGCGFRRIGTREKIARDRFGNWQDTTLFERRSRNI